MKIIAGNSNVPLATAVAQHLGVPLTAAVIRRFSDQEIFVEVKENVRGEDVFLIQSTSAPVNEHLMELMITLDALRRASARRATSFAAWLKALCNSTRSSSRAPGCTTPSHALARSRAARF